jgi:hypothetical protein
LTQNRGRLGSTTYDKGWHGPVLAQKDGGHDFSVP